MGNENLNSEKPIGFTEETVKKQLEAIYQHLGDKAKTKVEETLKKIIEQKK